MDDKPTSVEFLWRFPVGVFQEQLFDAGMFCTGMDALVFEFPVLRIEDLPREFASFLSDASEGAFGATAWVS